MWPSSYKPRFPVGFLCKDTNTKTLKKKNYAKTNSAGLRCSHLEGRQVLQTKIDRLFVDMG